MKIAKIRDVKTPTRGTSKSAGLDFYVPNTFCGYIPSFGSMIIPSGIKAQIPPGFALIAFNKSGICTKLGLQVGACVIDEDYQGEIHLHITNPRPISIKIKPGMKLMQFILVPVNYAEVEEVSIDELFTEVTERGDGGFGSTGTGLEQLKNANIFQGTFKNIELCPACKGTGFTPHQNVCAVCDGVGYVKK